MQRDYELTFILSTTLDEDASAATVERVNQLVAAGGGAVNEVHAWGRRRLAYPIEKQRDGFYVTTRFSMPTLAVGGFENDLRLNEGILRHLVVRQDEVPLRPLGPVPPPAPNATAAVAVARPIEAETEPDVVVEAGLDEGFEDVVPAIEE